MARKAKQAAVKRPRGWRKFNHPDVLMALDMYVGVLPSGSGKQVTGSAGAIASELGVSRRTVQFWIRDAWWNVIGCEATASNEAANAAYWKKVAQEGHSADLDNAYAQLQAQRGIILDPRPENYWPHE